MSWKVKFLDDEKKSKKEKFVNRVNGFKLVDCFINS